MAGEKARTIPYPTNNPPHLTGNRRAHTGPTSFCKSPQEDRTTSPPGFPFPLSPRPQTESPSGRLGKAAGRARECSKKTAAAYSPTCAVPSARPGLTSLFGMGRGGTPAPSHLNDGHARHQRIRPEKRPPRGKRTMREKKRTGTRKSFGQLVALGFAVTGFTPAPYQRHRL